MDIAQIKDQIKKILSGTLALIKGASDLPNFWSYIILSIALSIIFFIATFPYDVLIKNQLQEMGGDFGKALYIGEIDFNLTDTTSISDVTLLLDNGSEFDFNNINFDVGIFSALFSDTLDGNLIITDIKYKNDNTLLKGILSSDFNIEFNSYSEFPSKGEISIRLQNLKLDGLTIKGFDIPSVRFTLVKSDLKLLKKKISIKEMLITGPDVNGSITGDITIAKFAKSSRLNLNIEVDSKSTLLDNYRILLGNALDNNGNIKISVKGTISNPKFDLKKNASSGSPMDDLRRSKIEDKD